MHVLHEVVEPALVERGEVGAVPGLQVRVRAGLFASLLAGFEVVGHVSASKVVVS
ncbi:hypothetical protein ACFO6V_21060 [Promicromonospora alba]|uniref:Uncharacterized protein n=1 Tax=Promicromonospora alba TaxID=1616110 RepID=A0ABV9HMD9_9MICO